MDVIKDIRVLSSLEKLYDEDKMPVADYKGFSMLKNEKKSFQVALEVSADTEADLKTESFFKNIKAYTVEHIKSDFPMNKTDCDDYYRYSKSGYYPDLLKPVDDNRLHLKSGINVLWFEVDGRDAEAENGRIEIAIADRIASVDVEIIDAELDFSDFVYTNWFHSDCLMSYYGFDVFSDEYWRVVENYLKTAVEYGMNCVLTPIFTPPLDTEIGKERPTVQLVDVTVSDGEYSFNFDKLTQWIEMSERCGIKYFELAHLYTQWGARHAPKIMATVDGEYKRIFGWETKANGKAYKKFLAAFAKAADVYFKSHNLADRVFIHVSDEPNISILPAYARVSRYVHKIFKGYRIVDALSAYMFYRLKVVSNPIPANDHIDKFLGNVDDLWTYYCSGQRKYCVSNRFFCNESLRTRVIGYQMFKYDITGFLQWGYNFYYTQLSKALVNPFEVSDAGGIFPSGDSYVVYPAEDGTALHSIRLKVFYDGLQDMAALKTLAKFAGKKICTDIIDADGKLTFREYPHENNWMLDTREQINREIKNRSGK